MLIQFSVSNYKTFKDKAALSMVATSDNTCEEDNVIEVPKFKLRLLKSAVLYGANASGKSNFYDALAFMKYFVYNSSKNSQRNENIDVDCFRLNSDTINKPSEFEIIFIADETKYRYGFGTTKQKIISEWLYRKANTKETEVFYREGQDFRHHENFKTADILVKEKLIRENALLLSVANQFNDKYTMPVFNWFVENLRAVSGLDDRGHIDFTVSRIDKNEEKQKLLNLLKYADFGIDDIRQKTAEADEWIEELKISKAIKEILKKETVKGKYITDILTTHKVFNNDFISAENTEFSLENDESSGTQKFFSISGPIIHSLENGYTLFADELDSKLHPNLTCRLISLFNFRKTNPKGAQLIFNTHDTNLLKSKLFRRDQVWFTEKDRYGAAHLYSLADFKTNIVRKNDNWKEKYIQGRFGAVPYLGDFDDLFGK